MIFAAYGRENGLDLRALRRREALSRTLSPPSQAVGLTLAERAIAHLYESVMAPLLEASGQEFGGAEWWCQVYKPGAGLAFHFDKDEAAIVDQGRMINPIFSSIIYLTGSEEQDPREQPTAIVDQVFDQEAQEAVPETPERLALVFPKKVRGQDTSPGSSFVLGGWAATSAPIQMQGSFCVFDGRLGHGVLDSGSRSERRTLLVNWWVKQPRKIGRLTMDDVARAGLSLDPRGAHPSSHVGRGGPLLPVPVPLVRLPPPTDESSVRTVGAILAEQYIRVSGGETWNASPWRLFLALTSCLGCLQAMAVLAAWRSSTRGMCCTPLGRTRSRRQEASARCWCPRA